MHIQFTTKCGATITLPIGLIGIRYGEARHTDATVVKFFVDCLDGSNTVYEVTEDEYHEIERLLGFGDNVIVMTPKRTT